MIIKEINYLLNYFGTGKPDQNGCLIDGKIHGAIKLEKKSRRIIRKLRTL